MESLKAIWQICCFLLGRGRNIKRLMIKDNIA